MFVSIQPIKGSMKLQSKYWLILAFLPLFTILYINYFGQAFGQESSSEAETYVLRNV